MSSILPPIQQAAAYLASAEVSWPEHKQHAESLASVAEQVALLEKERDEALAAVNYEGAKATAEWAQSVINEKDTRIALLERKAAALDKAADVRICDGIGGIDIDERCLELMNESGADGDSEDVWRQYWRMAFLEAIEAAVQS